MEELIYKIIMSDSRNMAEVEDGSVQLVITSPPYWYLVRFSEDGDVGAENDLSRITDREKFFAELSKVWKECYRVLKRGGYLVCEWEDIPVGSWKYGYPREICIAGDMINSIERVGLSLISRWIWKKFGAGAVQSKFQYTLYPSLTKADPRAIANWAYCFVFKKRGGSRPSKLDFTREDWKSWCDGVWYIENPSSQSAGISGGAVFPYELVRRFMKIYSLPRDLILDPFLGTGTTMKVAYDLDRSCIGYEVLQKMLPIIKKKVGFGRQKLFSKVKWEVIL